MAPLPEILVALAALGFGCIQANTKQPKPLSWFKTLDHLCQKMSAGNVSLTPTDLAVEAVSLLDIEATSIHLWRPQSQSLFLAAQHGLPAAVAQQIAMLDAENCAPLQPLIKDLGRTVHVSSSDLVPSLSDIPDPFSTIWFAPIVHLERLLGFVGFWSPSYFAPSEEMKILYRFMAYQIAIVLDQQRVSQVNRQQKQALSLLNTVAELCSQGLDINLLLERAADEIQSALNSDLVEILLLRQGKDVLEIAVKQGPLAAQVQASIRQKEGIIGWVLKHGETYRSADVTQDPLYERTTSALRSALCAPLKVQGQVIGVINLEHGVAKAFSAEAQRLMMTVATQLAATIENRRLYDRQKERAEQLQTVTDIAQDMAAILDVDALFDRVVHLVKQRFNHYDVNILILDERRKKLVWQAGTKLTADAASGSLHCPLGQGITGWAALHKQPLLINDVTQEARYTPIPELPKTRAELAVPIQLGDSVLGVLDVQSEHLDAYDENDISVLQTLANLVAIALANARSFEHAKQRVAELMALRQVSLQLISTTDLSSVLDAIAESTLRLIGAKDVHIYLYDEETESFSFGTALWDDGAQEPATEGIRDDGLTATVAKRAEPIIITDISNHPLFQSQGVTDWELCSIASFPLLRGKRVLGVFNTAFATRHDFSKDELRILALLADQAASSIERVQLFEALNQRVEELRTVTQISEIATSTLDLDEIMEAILAQVIESIPSQAGAILLLENGLPQVHTTVPAARASSKLLQRYEDTVMQWITEHGQPLLVTDTSHDPRFDQEASVLSHVQAESLLVAPMLTKDQVVGGIELVNKEGATAFDHNDLLLLTAIAASAAAAIENARLYKERGRRLAETTVLCEMARHSTSSLAFDQVLTAIVEQLRTVISCRAISIFLLNKETEELTIAASSGVKQEFRERARIKVGEGVSGLVFKEARPINLGDVKKEIPDLGLDPEVNSLLVVPLIAKSRVIGTLSVDSTDRNAFTTAHERLLTIVSAQAASAIENAQLFEAEKQRAEELRQAYDELRELDRLKSQFVQNISHELRTPLTFVKGYADLLAENAMGHLSQEQRRGVEIIAHKTEAIIDLVNAIITLQEIESVPIGKEPTSLQQVVEMVVETARATASGSGVELEVKAPQETAWIMADEDRLVQVFDNLIGNAIKFSPDGGVVQIRIRDQGDSWQVEVEDQGIGIPEDQLEKIFERFYQVDGSTTRRFGGTGLGLAIAKEIVLNHDGTIWAESELGKGSTFFVKLPKAENPPD
jgi:GAF domain-containing protein